MIEASPGGKGHMFAMTLRNSICLGNSQSFHDISIGRGSLKLGPREALQQWTMTRSA